MIGLERCVVRLEPYTSEWVQLMLLLATQYPQDREAYTDGKASFILQVLQLAKANAWG